MLSATFNREKSPFAEVNLFTPATLRNLRKNGGKSKLAEVNLIYPRVTPALLPQTAENRQIYFRKKAR
jgi:hypothetical protein